ELAGKCRSRRDKTCATQEALFALPGAVPGFRREELALKNFSTRQRSCPAEPGCRTRAAPPSTAAGRRSARGERSSSRGPQPPLEHAQKKICAQREQGSGDRSSENQLIVHHRQPAEDELA